MGGLTGYAVVPDSDTISVETARKLYAVLLTLCIAGAFTLLFLGKPPDLYDVGDRCWGGTCFGWAAVVFVLPAVVPRLT